jgi:putative heme iron utilization protein
MKERDAYVEKMKANLDVWNAELDKLSAKMKASEADARIEYQKTIANLTRQRDEGIQQLDKLQAATEDAWQDMRKGFESAFNNISKAFGAAMDRYK